MSLRGHWLLVSYPRSAYAGWFDSIVQIDEPNVDFTLHIVPLPPEVISARLGRKAVEFRGSVIVSQRQGRAPVSFTVTLLLRMLNSYVRIWLVVR